MLGTTDAGLEKTAVGDQEIRDWKVPELVKGTFAESGSRERTQQKDQQADNHQRIERNRRVVKLTSLPTIRLPVDATMRLMVKRATTASRRRGKPRLGRKTFVYFTDDERKLIDQAARVERRSISSFIATAAIDAAEGLVNLRHRKHAQ